MNHFTIDTTWSYRIIVTPLSLNNVVFFTSSYLSLIFELFHIAVPLKLQFHVTSQFFEKVYKHRSSVLPKYSYQPFILYVFPRLG